MRRLLSLIVLAFASLACNLSERVLIPQQLPTLAVTPGPDFIAPPASSESATEPTVIPAEPVMDAVRTATVTLESVTGSMVGEGPGSMVADVPTATLTVEVITEEPATEAPTETPPQATRARPTAAPSSTTMLQPTEACVLNTEWQARYTIVSGDRVSVIAERYNLTTTQLAAANCLTNPDRISVGQVLIVPDGVVTAAAPSAIPLITPDADGFTTYVNRDYGFSLRYPPGWNRVEPGAYINLVSPDGSSVVEILIGDTATSPEAQAEACLAGQGCPRGAALESQPFEVNGLPAHRIDLGEAGSLRVIVFLTLNGRDLAIRGFGDAAAFDQILATFTAVR